MNVTYVIIVHVSVLTVLSVYVSGGGWTWFEAQTECRKRNQTLTFKEDGPPSNFWTGFYQRRSPWIKILGCYREYHIQSFKLCQIILRTASPGLCQEKCLEKNISIFAVQENLCICLARNFDYLENLLSPSTCSFACNNSELLRHECGGESAYSVFLTDLSSLEIQSHCLSLQCGKDPKFLDEHCEEYLTPLCRYSMNTAQAAQWRDIIGKCKSKGSYPIGNLNLSNVRSACDKLYDIGPRWIGVVRDQYIEQDHGQLIEEGDHITFGSCEKCVVENKRITCSFQSCEQRLSVYCCSENMLNEAHYSCVTENPLNKDTANKSRVVQIVVPVVVVLLLTVCVALISIYLYNRRKKYLKNNGTYGGNKSTTKTSESSADIDNNVNKNYFVLHQSNPSNKLANNSKKESTVENVYNDAQDGTYDHLGDKAARKQDVADDTYNHASSVMINDVSDYDVANQKRTHEDDNDYDQTSPAENSYGHLDRSSKGDTDYSELF